VHQVALEVADHGVHLQRRVLGQQALGGGGHRGLVDVDGRVA